LLHFYDILLDVVTIIFFSVPTFSSVIPTPGKKPAKDPHPSNDDLGPDGPTVIFVPVPWGPTAPFPFQPFTLQSEGAVPLPGLHQFTFYLRFLLFLRLNLFWSRSDESFISFSKFTQRQKNQVLDILTIHRHSSLPQTKAFLFELHRSCVGEVTRKLTPKDSLPSILLMFSFDALFPLRNDRPASFPSRTLRCPFSSQSEHLERFVF